MNPYWGAQFFEFFAIFARRVATGFSGGLASDEIQLFVMLLIALSTSLLGVFLVLRKMTMLANALSHTVLLGIVLAYLALAAWQAPGEPVSLSALLIAALITGLLTTFATQWLTATLKVQEDASIGLVFTALFATAILIVTLYTRSTHIGLEAVMGNVDALHLRDLTLVAPVALGSGFLIALFYKELALSSFDPQFARSLGMPTSALTALLMVLVAAVSIAAFRAVGVLLFLSLLVGPPLIARRLTHRLAPLIALSLALSALVAFLGVALSRHILSTYQLPLSTSGLTVTLLSLIFLIVKRNVHRAKLKKIR